MSRERDWLPTSAANHFQRLFAEAPEVVAPQRLGQSDAVIRLRYWTRGLASNRPLAAMTLRLAAMACVLKSAPTTTCGTEYAGRAVVYGRDGRDRSTP